MTPEAYEKVCATRPRVAMVGTSPDKDGTLLFGYDVEQRTWHVYQEDGEIHLLIHRPGDAEPERHKHGTSLPAHSLSPNKRLYPEGCDADFCVRLRELDVPLAFTTFGTMKSRPDTRGMVGRTYADFEPPRPAGP